MREFFYGEARRRQFCPNSVQFVRDYDNIHSDCENGLDIAIYRKSANYQPIQSAVAAALCRRTPNSIYQLEDSGRAHAATHAHRHHSVTTVAAFKLAQDR